MYEITQVPCMAHADCKHWYWQGSPWRPYNDDMLQFCSSWLEKRFRSNLKCVKKRRWGKKLMQK
ncbi:MAG: hypothetical protein ACK51L_04455 [bacterium]